MPRPIKRSDVYGVEKGWTLRRPFLWAGVAAVIASLAVVWLPVWACIAVGAMGLGAFLWRPCRGANGAFCLSVGLAFLAGGMWLRLCVIRPVEKLAGQEDFIVGVVERCPDDGNLYTVRIAAANKLPAGRRLLLYCGDSIAPKPYETVSSAVKYYSLYSSQRLYRADGIYLAAYPSSYGEGSMQVTADAAQLWERQFYALRQKLLQRIRQVLPGDTGALLAGICLGEHRELSAAWSVAFRRSGLTHLLVVSGLHLTLLAGSVWGLFRLCRVGRRAAALLTLLAVAAFSLLVGLSPSVIRAGVACSVMLVGRLFRRRADGLNSMGLALLLLLVGNPYACLDVGLQLSFAAATGVLAVAPVLKRFLTARLPAGAVGRFVAEGIAVTMGASLLLTPLLCTHFGYVSLFTLPANLLASAPAGWALLLGWIGLLLPAVSRLAWAWQGVLFAAGGLCDWLAAVASWFGGAGAVVNVGRLWQMVLLGGGCWLLAACLIWGTPRLCKQLTCGLLALAVGVTATAWLVTADTVCVHIYPAQDEGVLLLEQRGVYGLLLTDEEALRPAKWLLDDSGCTYLDFVVIADMDSSSAGALQSLLRERNVERIYSVGETAWAIGFPWVVQEVLYGTSLTLYQGCRLELFCKDGWRLMIGNSVLTVQSGEAPLSAAADVAVYLGMPTAFGAVKQAVVIGENKESDLPLWDFFGQSVTVITDKPVYLTTRGNGDWSMRRWR